MNSIMIMEYTMYKLTTRRHYSTVHDYHDYDKIIVIMSNNWWLDDYAIIVTGLTTPLLWPVCLIQEQGGDAGSFPKASAHTRYPPCCYGGRTIQKYEGQPGLLGKYTGSAWENNWVLTGMYLCLSVSAIFALAIPKNSSYTRSQSITLLQACKAAEIWLGLDFFLNQIHLRLCNFLWN